jgi:hypothetical protein
MSNDSQERREFTRVDVKMEVEVSGGLCGILGVSHDVSLKGIFVACDTSRLDEMDVGRDCRITIFLGEREGEGLRIEANGAILRVEESGVGIEFSDMEKDSFDHLHNLVLFNTTNPQRVEMEFQSHAGVKGWSMVNGQNRHQPSTIDH